MGTGKSMECKAKRNNTPKKQKRDYWDCPKCALKINKEEAVSSCRRHCFSIASLCISIERQSITTHHKKRKELAMTAPSSPKA